MIQLYGPLLFAICIASFIMFEAFGGLWWVPVPICYVLIVHARPTGGKSDCGDVL